MNGAPTAPRKISMPKKTKPKKRRLGRVPPAKGGTKIATTGPVTPNIGPGLDDRGFLSGQHSDAIAEGVTQLARGTDALVDRVVNSDRDRNEHILDLSKAYFSEETSQGQHSVQCDRCLLKSPGASSVKASIKIAEAAGWVVTEKYDHCPVCKDGSKLLKGGSAALSLPPKLSHSDLILITRLNYIGGNIERGASVEAFLQNSIRSQHRSMLSDLAQETNYDTVPLIERVTNLITRNAEIHPVFSGETRKAWAFFLQLYAALKTEDGGG